MDDIQGKIRDYISTNILFNEGQFPYSDDDSFLEEGIVDSVGVMELLVFVQEQFGFRVEDEEVTPQNFDSISRLATYISKRLQPVK